MEPATAAGFLATAVFVGSTFPMLVRAKRTRDLGSYSRGHLVLANTGNAVQAVYVASLPPGPVWVLHLFYTVVTVQMLVWHLRHAPRPRPTVSSPARERSRVPALTSTNLES